MPIAIIPTGGSSDTCKKVTCGVQTDLLTVCDPSLAYPQGSDTVCESMAVKWLSTAEGGRVLSVPVHGSGPIR